MSSTEPMRPVLIRRSLQALLLCALLMPGAAVVSESREVVGRVVSVRGAVFAGKLVWASSRWRYWPRL